MNDQNVPQSDTVAQELACCRELQSGLSSCVDSLLELEKVLATTGGSRVAIFAVRMAKYSVLQAADYIRRADFIIEHGDHPEGL